MNRQKKLLWKTACLLIALAGVSSTALSQSIVRSTLTWKAMEVNDSRTQTSKGMTCDFVTNGKKSVDWIQKGGALKTSFIVTAVEGEWLNVASQGSITYVLERNGKSCKMLIERNASGVFVTLDFTSSRLRFKIDSVN